ncbi:MAG: hypothetical protein RLZZ536_298 [Planctomycetota bacterium]|jgi:hypothetical protein
MVLPLTKASLSPSRHRLLVMLQQINFGRIEGLVVRDHQPVFNPPPTVIREVKFGGDNSPRPELATDDFALKSQVVELFKHLDQHPSCHIETLEIKHGLPFRMLIREAAA